MTILDPARERQAIGESLAELLWQYATRVMRKTKKNQAQIARDAWLDESYVSRLISGQRENPSRDALLLLAGWGLGLSAEETDKLLLAADYKPLVFPRNR